MRDEVIGQPLVDQHRGVPHEKIVPGERRKLQGVLQQAGAGRETRPGEAGHAGIIARDGVIDAIEVEPVTLGEHVKLVGNGKIEVSPTVGEELGEFRLGGRQFNNIRRKDGKKLARPAPSLPAQTPPQSGAAAPVPRAPSFGNPLRTKGDVHLPSQRPDPVVNDLGDPRINGAAQHQQRVIGEMIQQIVNAPAEVAESRDSSICQRGCPPPRWRHRRRQAGVVQRRHQAFSHHLLEQFRSALLQKRHLAPVHLFDFGSVDIQ